MSEILFRLMERHQRLDTRLHLARVNRRASPLEILRLSRLRQTLGRRIARLLLRPALAR